MTESSQAVTKKPLAIKFIALLSIVRWYNILLTIVAQYLSAFVLMRDQPQTLNDLLVDFKLHGIVVINVFVSHWTEINFHVAMMQTLIVIWRLDSIQYTA